MKLIGYIRNAYRRVRYTPMEIKAQDLEEINSALKKYYSRGLQEKFSKQKTAFEKFKR